MFLVIMVIVIMVIPIENPNCALKHGSNMGNLPQHTTIFMESIKILHGKKGPFALIPKESVFFDIYIYVHAVQTHTHKHTHTHRFRDVYANMSCA